MDKDWFGEAITPLQTFSIAIDQNYLWFLTARDAPSYIHPAAKPGEFTPELWKYDVSELFLANPSTGHYLEFNLAANGAWWASSFSSERVATTLQPKFSSSVITYSDESEPNKSIAALAVSLEFLKDEIGFGKTTTANATFIQGTPAQKFLTAAALPGKEPDFHQPSNFLSLNFTALL